MRQVEKSLNRVSLLVQYVEYFVLMHRYLVHGIVVALFQLYRLHGLDWNLDDSVAECESQLAQSERHTDAHDDTDEAATLFNDLLTSTA